MKKIGIFSGTFDPVHQGHINFANQVIDKLSLEKVFLLPEPRPRRKQGIKAFEHRVNMLKLATKNYKKLGVIILEQARFTPHETLPIIQKRLKGCELYMLMGDDMLDHFSEWPSIEDLINNVQFIIAIRKYDENHVRRVIDLIATTKGIQVRYKTIQIEKSNFSSREIRKEIKQNKQPKGLSPEVINYIKLNKLYSASENAQS